MLPHSKILLRKTYLFVFICADVADKWDSDPSAYHIPHTTLIRKVLAVTPSRCQRTCTLYKHAANNMYMYTHSKNLLRKTYVFLC